MHLLSPLPSSAASEAQAAMLEWGSSATPYDAQHRTDHCCTHRRQKDAQATVSFNDICTPTIGDGMEYSIVSYSWP